MGGSWQGPPPFGPASNFTMPWFVARSGYGFLLDSTWLNRFDLDQGDVWRGEDPGPADPRIRPYRGPAPARGVRGFPTAAASGRPPAPAPPCIGAGGPTRGNA